MKEPAGSRSTVVSPERFAQLVLLSRSVRRFQEDSPVRMETLRRLVDLARLAPSTANRQSLRFLLVTAADLRAEIFPALRWAAALPDWQGPGPGERPAAYIVLLGDRQIAQEFERDYGIAAQTIMLGAVTRGLAGCMIHSMDRQAVRRALALEDRYELLLVLALGAPAEEVRVEEMPAGGDIRYWRDEVGVHHVPKRSLEDLILREVGS